MTDLDNAVARANITLRDAATALGDELCDEQGKADQPHQEVEEPEDPDQGIQQKANGRVPLDRERSHGRLGGSERSDARCNVPCEGLPNLEEAAASESCRRRALRGRKRQLFSFVFRP